MKKLSELTDFYYKSLFPTLQKLEKERKQLRHRIVTLAIISLSLTIILFTFLQKEFGVSGDLILFFLFAFIGLGGFFYRYLTQDYTDAFKKQVIAPLIKEIDTKLQYLPKEHISLHAFESSKIFTSRIDKFNGNDLVQGEIDGVSLKFSDLHVQRKEKNSKNQTTYSTIFQGLFLVADFHKHFKGTTVVLPDVAQKLFGEVVGSWLQKNNMSQNELAKMDHPEFEKLFVVYTNDQIEARYILTHSLMEKLVKFRNKIKHPISVSFVNNSIHLAIEYNKDLFEASVLHSLLDYKIAMEYIGNLHFCISIVEELKLNQKLWSKQ